MPGLYSLNQGGSGGGGAEWGTIGGTLSTQADLQAELDLKANLLGNDDIEIAVAAKGLILRNAAGTRYRITVVDDGGVPTLTLTAL
jgi:hypothetical protein